jgi:hypothetical protein
MELEKLGVKSDNVKIDLTDKVSSIAEMIAKTTVESQIIDKAVEDLIVKNNQAVEKLKKLNVAIKNTAIATATPDNPAGVTEPKSGLLGRAFNAVTSIFAPGGKRDVTFAESAIAEAETTTDYLIGLITAVNTLKDDQNQLKIALDSKLDKQTFDDYITLNTESVKKLGLTLAELLGRLDKLEQERTNVSTSIESAILSFVETDKRHDAKLAQLETKIMQMEQNGDGNSIPIIINRYTPGR